MENDSIVNHAGGARQVFIVIIIRADIIITLHNR